MKHNLNISGFKRVFCTLTIFLALLSSCSGRHFLEDSSYRKQVKEDFDAKKKLFKTDEFFQVFNRTDISKQEREALMFLYAYMPLGDITDYPGEFYLNNYRQSVKAKQEMEWGENIPDELFRHFVLPIRVNNENLDNSREIFYNELKNRVKGLSIKEAILEVNHWCHEKVVYRPSDARTSSPLASVRTAYGRCGEESTLTVAALRSVGIPARQVYTPRWAHTDDNHAWVEAWADGTWYFIGACEPEPVLNLAWFNAPASRSMLMHTKVFGLYNGPEDVMRRTANYTEINVIDNYAKSAKGIVTVVDDNDKPIEGAYVEFKIYNYAEFFTISRKQTNEDGQVQLSAGLGDLMIFAYKDNAFGFSKLTFGKDESISIKLDKKVGDEFKFEVDIVPPKEDVNRPEVSLEMVEANKLRLAKEDSIRMKYESTMLDEYRAKDIVAQYKVSERLSDDAVKVLVGSRGNHKTIVSFLEHAQKTGNSDVAVEILLGLSAKDWRDVTLDVLASSYEHYTDYSKTGHKRALRLANCRIAHEMLTPYYEFFKHNTKREVIDSIIESPETLVQWVKENITINNDMNSQRIIISPKGVLLGGVADNLSRDILFVAMARSLGVYAWKDAVTGNIMYINPSDDKEELDLSKAKLVDFNKETAVTKASNATLRANYSPLKWLPNPKYYSHFTLSKYNERGSFDLLNYDEGDADMGGGATWAGLLKNGATVDAGYYLLMSGTRLANGSVMVSGQFIDLPEGENKTSTLTMRDQEDKVSVIGNFNSEILFGAPDYDKSKPNDKKICCDTEYENGFKEGKRSILDFNGRGYYMIIKAKANHEPSNHVLADLDAMADEVAKSFSGKALLLFSSQQEYEKFVKSANRPWPHFLKAGIDLDNRIEKEIRTNMNIKQNADLPLIIIGDTFNRVVFVSQGYTIGIAEQIIKVSNKLKE